MTALLYVSVQISHDSGRASTIAWPSNWHTSDCSFVDGISYTCAFPAVTCKNIYHENGFTHCTKNQDLSGILFLSENTTKGWYWVTQFWCQILTNYNLLQTEIWHRHLNSLLFFNNRWKVFSLLWDEREKSEQLNTFKNLLPANVCYFTFIFTFSKWLKPLTCYQP